MALFNEYGNPDLDTKTLVETVMSPIGFLVNDFYDLGATIEQMRAMEAYVLQAVATIFAEKRLIQQMKIKKEKGDKTSNS